MEPEYQRELYKDVSCARYSGYASSVTSMGAAFTWTDGQYAAQEP